MEIWPIPTAPSKFSILTGNATKRPSFEGRLNLATVSSVHDNWAKRTAVPNHIELGVVGGVSAKKA